MTSTADELERQLEAAYAAIEEIDEDLRAGRISETDHKELRQRAETHAAQLLAQSRRAEGKGAGASPATAHPRAGARRTPVVMVGGAAALFAVGVVVGVVLDRAWSTQPAVPAAFVPAAAPAVAPVTPGAETPGVPPSGSNGPASTPTSASAATAGPAIPGHPSAPSPHAAGPGRPPGLMEPQKPPSERLQAMDKELGAGNAPTSKFLAFARLALEEKQRGAALSAYRYVLSKEPRNAEAIAGIGIILHDGNFVDQALARLDQALAIDPKLAAAHWHRAQILFEAKQDYREAARAGEAFLALAPSGADAERARALVAAARQREHAGPGAKAPAADTTR